MKLYFRIRSSETQILFHLAHKCNEVISNRMKRWCRKRSLFRQMATFVLTAAKAGISMIVAAYNSEVRCSINETVDQVVDLDDGGQVATASN